MIYLDDATYFRLVAALASAKPCPATGDYETAIKLALGEAGDIWPVSSRNDGDDQAAKIVSLGVSFGQRDASQSRSGN